MLPGAFLEAQEVYQDLLAQGVSPAEARWRTLGATGAIAGLNAIPVSTMLGRSRVLPKLVGSALGEAITEWAEEPVQAGFAGQDILEAARQGVNVIPPSLLFGLGGGTAGAFLTRARAPQFQPGFEFVSPSLAENLTFEQALGRLKSDEHKRLRMVFTDIDQQTGFGDSQALNAVGDWSDGAENSVFEFLPRVPDYETLRYNAALKGKAAFQKAVIPFLRQADGPSRLYEATVSNQDFAALRSTLDRHGVTHRTLIPLESGVRIAIFDKDGLLAQDVAEVAKELGATEFHEYKGQGEILGGNTRAEGLAAYNRTISDYQRRHPDTGDRPDQRPVGPGGFSDFWAAGPTQEEVTPNLSRSAAEAGGAIISSSRYAPPGTQALPSQRSTLPEPSASLTARTMAPSTLEGGTTTLTTSALQSTVPAVAGAQPEGGRAVAASGAPVGTAAAGRPAERLGVIPAWATGVPPLTLTAPASEAEPGLPTYAADKSGFNLSLLPTQGPRQLVDEIARRNYAEWRGKGADVVPNEKTLALAQALGWDARKLKAHLARSRLDAARLAASADLAQDAAHQLYLAQQKAKLSGSYEDKLDFERALAGNASILADFAGLASEQGRALQILRTMQSSKLGAQALLEQIASSEVPTEAKMALIESMQGDLAKVGKAALKIMNINTSDAFYELWINMLLSNLPTHTANIVGNGIITRLNDVVHLVAAGLGVFHKGDKVTVREALARLAAEVDAIREALHGLSFEPIAPSRLEERPGAL